MRKTDTETSCIALVRALQDKAAKDQLLALHREAAVQEAVAAVVDLLPARGMVLTRARAAFVLTHDGEVCREGDGPARLLVARLVGSLGEEEEEPEAAGAAGVGVALAEAALQQQVQPYLQERLPKYACVSAQSR